MIHFLDNLIATVKEERPALKPRMRSRYESDDLFQERPELDNRDAERLALSAHPSLMENPRTVVPPVSMAQKRPPAADEGGLSKKSGPERIKEIEAPVYRREVQPLAQFLNVPRAVMPAYNKDVKGSFVTDNKNLQVKPIAPRQENVAEMVRATDKHHPIQSRSRANQSATEGSHSAIQLSPGARPTRTAEIKTATKVVEKTLETRHSETRETIVKETLLPASQKRAKPLSVTPKQFKTRPQEKPPAQASMIPPRIEPTAHKPETTPVSPNINVSIGTVEIRAMSPRPARPAPPRSTATKPMSLDTYLQQHSGGSKE
ncbi:MAG: hypothetical protein GY753_09260 [Gammaproteobacteria bacterium]|nr:hypothetical protein [Gammaproteobacteria bacterium]